MIEPFGIEAGRSALQSMDLVARRQQEFRKIRAVLAGVAGDQSFAGRHLVILHGNGGVKKFQSIESR
jgi:hypothetical protein